MERFLRNTGKRFGMRSGETAIIGEGLDPPFTVLRPERADVPFVFNSPHSGRVYPRAFIESSRLELRTLRKSEDTFVDELFEPVVALGAPLMHAHFPRAYLDVNREPYELDPALITDSLPRYANTQSVRVVGGLGTIARVVTESEEIYRQPLTLGAALERINGLYKPYHHALGGLMEGARQRFGVAVLVDCHSMPSNPLCESGGTRPDFVLGDRFSTSCNPEFTRFIARQLKDMGYAVAFNKPYAGGYITEHYGRPADGLHALQIEVNRALYMDEAGYVKTEGFATLRDDIARLAGSVFEMSAALFDVPKAAAE